MYQLNLGARIVPRTLFGSKHRMQGADWRDKDFGWFPSPGGRRGMLAKPSLILRRVALPLWPSQLLEKSHGARLLQCVIAWITELS